MYALIAKQDFDNYKINDIVHTTLEPYIGYLLSNQLCDMVEYSDTLNPSCLKVVITPEVPYQQAYWIKGEDVAYSQPTIIDPDFTYHEATHEHWVKDEAVVYTQPRVQEHWVLDEVVVLTQPRTIEHWTKDDITVYEDPSDETYTHYPEVNDDSYTYIPEANDESWTFHEASVECWTHEDVTVYVLPVINDDTYTFVPTVEAIPEHFTIEEDLVKKALLLKEQQLQDKISKGKRDKQCCEDILNLVGGYNDYTNLTAEQITTMQDTFSDIEKALMSSRPYVAKYLISQVTPDGVLVTQDLLDDINLLFTRYSI